VASSRCVGPACSVTWTPKLYCDFVRVQSEDDTTAANKFLADNARANELLVEVAKLWMKSQDAESKFTALEFLEKNSKASPILMMTIRLLI